MRRAVARFLTAIGAWCFDTAERLDPMPAIDPATLDRNAKALRMALDMLGDLDNKAEDYGWQL